ncbi:MAG: DUF4249 domain-containing protein [Prolixibacteraceae bacterium]|nr:DUF4249 domain-containing protein [Prolixibacteraceae bacterium]
MLSKYKIKTLLLTIGVALFGCQYLVTEQFPDFDSIPTINSVLVEGKPVSINIDLTGGLDSLPLQKVNNATVNLYIDGHFSEKMEYTREGVLTSKTIVEPGKEYQCEVIIPGFDTLFCKQVIPIPGKILKVEHKANTGMTDDGYTLSSKILTFKNNPSEKQYYEIKTKGTGKYDNIDTSDYLFHNYIQPMPQITDPVLLNEGIPIALFSNETIKDSVYTMTLHYTSSGSKIYSFIIELRSVTYDYYRYQKQYYLYGEGKYGDITKKAFAFPLYSNIENGYGIFAGYSVSLSDTITSEMYENH